MPTELKNISLNKGNPYKLVDVIKEDYKIDLPIRGGWGYSEEDPIIIDKALAEPGLLFDGVGIEYIIVEKRIYSELIVFRQLDDRFGLINWKLISQGHFGKDGLHFDRLKFKVSCFRDPDIEFLKEHNRKATTEEDYVEHDKERDERICWYETEYFFDITSFYGM
jgi:hypothetical protein